MRSLILFIHRFTLPPAQPNSPGNVQLNKNNPISLANGSSLAAGQGCNSRAFSYYEAGLERYLSTYTDSTGQNVSIADVIYATNHDQLYARTIQSNQANLASFLAGKILKIDLNCNNGLLGCAYFTVDGNSSSTLPPSLTNGSLKLRTTVTFTTLLIIFCYAAHSSKIAPPSSPSLHLVPPQPSQYTTSVIWNGQSAMYYADTTVHRDRLDVSNQNYATITDFQNYRYYVILKDACSWVQIPGKISPLLVFPNYDFNGTQTHNSTLCYKWSGCHYYEIPPAPFNYYATVNGNIPVNLNLPTIDVNIQFLNFTFGPPSSTVFDIPSNCTKSEFNPLLHPIFPYGVIGNSAGENFC